MKAVRSGFDCNGSQGWLSMPRLIWTQLHDIIYMIYPSGGGDWILLATRVNAMIHGAMATKMLNMASKRAFFAWRKFQTVCYLRANTKWDMPHYYSFCFLNTTQPKNYWIMHSYDNDYCGKENIQDLVYRLNIGTQGSFCRNLLYLRVIMIKDIFMGGYRFTAWIFMLIKMPFPNKNKSYKHMGT